MDGREAAFVWAGSKDIAHYHERIMALGRLLSVEREDPEETGDPYRLVERFEVANGGEAEVYWMDETKRELGDIRLIVPVDSEEERQFRAEKGLPVSKTFEEVRGDTHSEHLSEYMKLKVKAILG